MQFNSTIRLPKPIWAATIALLCCVGCLDPVNQTSADAQGIDLNSSFNGSDQTSGFDIGLLGTDALGADAGDAEIGDAEIGDADAPLESDAGDAVSDALPNDADPDGVDAAGDATDAEDTASDATASDATASDATADAEVVGCGDGKCSGPAGESCASCPADCGACPPFCGNQQCDATETCSSCTQDCGACPPPVCEVLTSKNCSEGKQCFPDGKSNLCYPAGTKVHGNNCVNANDCVVGALCVAGQCRSLCDWSSAKPTVVCQPGVPCEKLVFDGAGDVGQGVGVCKPAAACDPLSDIGCPAGQKCNPIGWFKTCTAPGSAGQGAPCASSGQCQLGLLCQETIPGSGTCRPRCHTSGGNPACQAGTCTAILDSTGKPIPGSVGTCGA